MLEQAFELGLKINQLIWQEIFKDIDPAYALFKGSAIKYYQELEILNAYRVSKNSVQSSLDYLIPGASYDELESAMLDEQQLRASIEHDIKRIGLIFQQFNWPEGPWFEAYLGLENTQILANAEHQNFMQMKRNHQAITVDAIYNLLHKPQLSLVKDDQESSHE
jgi:hypothetical protein